MIALRLPASAAEQVCFELSPLAELVHSWHVLTVPGRHALQLPWARRCRDLPGVLRADLREWSWVVRDYVPALFESGAPAWGGAFGLSTRRVFEEELNRVGALPAEHVAADLARTILFDAEPDSVVGGDPLAAERLARIRSDPTGTLTELLTLVDRYWRAAFASEWRDLEPRLLEAVAEAGRIMPSGVLRMLGGLAPAIRVDARTRTVLLNRPHEHLVDVAARAPLRLTPSFYSWPHVRVTCDEPWPLRLTYPVVPLSPRTRRTEPARLLAGLRALGAQPRLDILRLLREQPRSTQELSGLLGMSEAAVSRHLRQLLAADLVTSHREGYYVLYRVEPETLAELADQLRHGI